MLLHRITLLVAFSAIALSLFNIYMKPKGYNDVIATCRNDRLASVKIIPACTKLLQVQSISKDMQALFLSKRAWAFRRQKDFVPALADIDQMLNLQPENAHAWVLRAYINDASGARDIVANDFEEALEIEPDPIATLTSRAQLFFRRKEYEPALLDYQRVLEIQPKHKLAGDRIVTIHVRRGETDLAVKAMEQAVLLSPDDPKVHRSMGVLQLLYSGDYERAKTALLRSDELDSNNRFTLLFLGAAYLKLGNDALGKSYVEKYVKLQIQSTTSGMTLIEKADFMLADSALLGNRSLKFLLSGMGYSFIGYPDIARNEFEKFLEEGGWHAARVLHKQLRRNGFCRGPCSMEDQDSEFNKELDKYIEHLELSIYVRE